MMKIFRSAAISIAVLFSGLALAAGAPPKPNPDSFTPAQTTQIQQIVRGYLLNNPQILVEMSKKLRQSEQQQAAQQQKVTEQKIPQYAKQLFFSPNDAVIGNPKGNVTVVEFFDSRCGHCKRMQPVIDNLIKQNPNLRVVLKDFPIFGGSSLYAAKAQLATFSMNKKKYPAFHEALLTFQGQLTDEDVMTVAKKVGLNVKKLKKAMKSPKVQKIIDANFKLAKALNISFTPAFFVGKTDVSASKLSNPAYFPGAVPEDVLQAGIDQAAKA